MSLDHLDKHLLVKLIRTIEEPLHAKYLPKIRKRQKKIDLLHEANNHNLTVSFCAIRECDAVTCTHLFEPPDNMFHCSSCGTSMCDDHVTFTIRDDNMLCEYCEEDEGLEVGEDGQEEADPSSVNT